MGEVNAQIVLDWAAEERVQRHSQTLGFDIPKRHVDGREAGHQRRAVAPARGHVVNAIPMRFRTGGIEAHIFRLQPAEHRLGYVGAAFKGRFAQPGDPRVGVHLDKHQIAPAHRDFVDRKAGDFDFPSGAADWNAEAKGTAARLLIRDLLFTVRNHISPRWLPSHTKTRYLGKASIVSPEEQPMGHKYANILETVGNTPVVRINKLAPPGVNLFVKIEAFNPLGSVKDRLALGVIEDAEKTGKLKPGQTVIEATSGNTGIGLAMVCAQKGYPLVVTMAETFSIERRKLMRFLGAKVVITPAAGRGFGMVAKAIELAESAWVVSHPAVRK